MSKGWYSCNMIHLWHFFLAHVLTIITRNCTGGCFCTGQSTQAMPCQCPIQMPRKCQTVHVLSQVTRAENAGQVSTILRVQNIPFLIINSILSNIQRICSKQLWKHFKYWIELKTLDKMNIYGKWNIIRNEVQSGKYCRNK